MNGEQRKTGVIKGFLYAPSIFLDIPRLNILLFVATFFTTYYINGPAYAICIITILLAHEMGHFIMCRKYHVDATWPFFLPVPLPPFGTFGAVIKMKGHIPDKRALFDIGVAGPIGGLIFAVPITIIGLYLSEIHPIPKDSASYIGLGEPILFSFFAKMTIGSVSEGFDIVLSPIAFAGWAGLFVTALNLLPIGQLDGGHVVYALLGKHSSIIYKAGIGAFCLFALFVYPGWIVFAVMLLLFGFKHPAPIDPFTHLDFKRKCVGVIMLIVFLLCFTPIPLKL
ncbi:MAG: site-2 protease family protein [Candidatus Scalindua sediminis]|nr:site-2 protease family protein [Candidatus Scalindua sediminis]HDY68670.1 site-2 protease family protein [Candidatus Scalindua sp.]